MVGLGNSGTRAGIVRTCVLGVEWSAEKEGKSAIGTRLPERTVYSRARTHSQMSTPLSLGSHTPHWAFTGQKMFCSHMRVTSLTRPGMVLVSVCRCEGYECDGSVAERRL